MGTKIMGTYTCKACGFVTENDGEAKFCQQCGASLVEQFEAPAPPPVTPAPQINVRAGPRMVMGPVIKEHLLAQLLEGGEKKSGHFEVRRDGVIYVTSAKHGNQVIQAPLEDIASVGLGYKNNILAIHLKNGNEILVKMGGAERWVTLIRQLMG